MHKREEEDVASAVLRGRKRQRTFIPELIMSVDKKQLKLLKNIYTYLLVIFFANTCVYRYKKRKAIT